MAGADNYVQIKASKKELEIRIKAFMERKRLESDIANVQEFCHRLPLSESDCRSGVSTCARTDSLLVSRKDSKSHLRVSKVVNTCGPQTQSGVFVATPKNVAVESTTSSGIEERLRNMEQHLGLNKNQAIPSDVYCRLKELENRILYLESVSPEYLDGDLRLIGHKGEEEVVGQIDQRIVELRRKLRNY